MMWPTPPPSGTVQWPEEVSFQSAETVVLLSRYQPLLIYHVPNGEMSRRLVPGRLSLPVTDQFWAISTPAIHSFFVFTTATAGPMSNFPWPRVSSVAVGKTMLGPKPKVQPLRSAGENNVVTVRSPNPLVRSLGPIGWLMMGTWLWTKMF